MKTMIKKTLSSFLILSVLLSVAYISFEPEISKAQASDTDTVTVTQTVTEEITISDAADMTLTPSISGITGGSGSSTDHTTWTITTNNTSGYELTLNKNNTLRLSGGGANREFSDYASSTPVDYNWSSPGSGQTRFGFNVSAAASSTDIVAKYRDNGAGTCGTGDNVSDGQCWNGIPDTGDEEAIANRTTWTPTGGVTVSVKFRTEAGADNYLESGDYTTTITATATTS